MIVHLRLGLAAPLARLFELLLLLLLELELELLLELYLLLRLRLLGEPDVHGSSPQLSLVCPFC
jgi:hypothetical protein